MTMLHCISNHSLRKPNGKLIFALFQVGPNLYLCRGLKPVEVYSGIVHTSDKCALAFVSVEHLYKFHLKKLSTLKALAVITNCSPKFFMT